MKIRIYQVNENNPAAVPFLFTRYTEAIRIGGEIKAEHYKMTFDGDVATDSLQELFTMFNIASPEGYTGRSMSVSDVIEIIRTKDSSIFYFCDNIGFVRIRFDSEKVQGDGNE